MKRYKLIREYPGSPKLETIFEYWTDGISEQIYNKSTTPSFIPLKIVKDYPEFWEEIDNNFILPEIWWVRITKKNLKDVNKFLGFKLTTNSIGCIAGMLRKYDDNKIVKAWNDTPITFYGSTFGNEITTEQFKKYVLKKTEEKPKNYHVSLNSIKHIKQPLFTTEDGVDIFEKNTKYYIVKDKLITSHLPYVCYEIDLTNPNIILALDDLNIHRFSTKEKAEEYILMNKPCLSINDIIMKNQVSYPSNETLVGITFSKLKELVKQKIKE